MVPDDSVGSQAGLARLITRPESTRLPAGAQATVVRGPVSRCRWDPVSSRAPSTMPPKKGGDGIKPPPIIGRFGTSLKIGIVGLPNVGKSTFFNVLTNSQASAENFPFCTIDPNESRVPVPDERFDFLCQYHKPASKIPAFLNVVDIAGLVKGAHNGQGLGNAFLSHISACDGIFHLTRAFEDDDITHVEGSVDPVRDIEIIHEELQLKDEEMIGPIIDKLEKVAVRGGDKKLKPEYDIMCKVKSWVIDQKKPVRFYHDWNDKEIEVLNKHLFLTSKPMVYLVNLSEKDYIRKKNKWLIKIKEWVDKYDPGALVIPFSGALELRLQELSAEERQKYLEANMTQSALPKIIKAGFAALQLEYFFTAGPDEVRAWTIRKGTKAPQAAGKIHTDFEKGFIMAEVMKYEDFKEEGSENAVKAAGNASVCHQVLPVCSASKKCIVLSLPCSKPPDSLYLSPCCQTSLKHSCGEPYKGEQLVVYYLRREKANRVRPEISTLVMEQALTTAGFPDSGSRIARTQAAGVARAMFEFINKVKGDLKYR
ncbi:hypothetical protein R6Z07F_002845 [Ovis aries]